MSLLDVFRVGGIKRERDQLRSYLDNIEIKNLVEVRSAVEKGRAVLNDILRDIESRRQEATKIEADIAARRQQIVETDDKILLQEFGIYEPKYRLATVAEYKARLDGIRERQAMMVKDGRACASATNWTINGSKAEGQRMARDYTKLIVRAFNTECDGAVDGVKFFNMDASRARIQKSFDILNRLGSRMSIQLTHAYLAEKLEELELAFEFQIKKQSEKEDQRKLREQQREEAKLQREIDAAREALAKEERHYKRALSSLQDRLAKTSSAADRSLIEAEIATIEERMREVDEKRQDVDYRAQNAQAGYVYVISNIGAFGEGVFKIGVTRRLEPMDRIDELGDASVPFDFDVHAIVFSDDAYRLEAALHRHFAANRLNMVNGRKEFFRAPIEEIEQVLRESFAKPVEVVKIAEAAEYRQSVKLGAPEAPITVKDEVALAIFDVKV